MIKGENIYKWQGLHNATNYFVLKNITLNKEKIVIHENEIGIFVFFRHIQIVVLICNKQMDEILMYILTP